MQSHLRKIEFQAVWQEVKLDSAGTFTFLERLDKHGFEGDPAKWKHE